jgi:hypothetical protein
VSERISKDELYYSMKASSLHFKIYEIFEENRNLALQIAGCHGSGKIELSPEEWKLVDKYIFNKF